MAGEYFHQITSLPLRASQLARPFTSLSKRAPSSCFLRNLHDRFSTLHLESLEWSIDLCWTFPHLNAFPITPNFFF
jgi:hypothetical protein